MAHVLGNARAPPPTITSNDVLLLALEQQQQETEEANRRALQAEWDRQHREEQEAEFARRLAQERCCGSRKCNVWTRSWAMVFFDAALATLALYEYPPKEEKGLVWFFRFNVYDILVPSVVMWLFALLKDGGYWKRQLVRFFCYKISVFSTVWVGYFIWPAPDQGNIVPFLCNPDASYHSFDAEQNLKLFGGPNGSVERCGRRMRFYILVPLTYYTGLFIYAYIQAHILFRAHPENDDKYVWLDGRPIPPDILRPSHENSSSSTSSRGDGRSPQRRTSSISRMTTPPMHEFNDSYRSMAVSPNSRGLRPPIEIV